MMFKGSEKVGQGEHFYLVFNNGGNMNGSTNNDRTNYFETLPKNQLDLGLFLESDRMRSLAITKENLDNQRATVQEERRLGVDNEPYGKTDELLEEMAYDNFAYKHSVIGSMEDLSAASVDDVKGFFKTYYAPNNAALVLIGDFQTADVLARVKKYFGDIPRQSPPPPVDMTEATQTGERRANLTDKLARLPRVDMAFKGPFGNTPEAYSFGVLATVLGGGESSRLYQKLVKEKEAAISVMAYFGQRRGPGLFQIVATPRPGKSLDEVETLIAEEIARLQNEPPTEKEILKARNSARRMAVQMREGSLFTATRIGEFALYYNDPGLINTQLEKIMAVTPASVQGVAKKYLNPAQRTVIQTQPAGGGGPRGPRAAN
jgi:predicted Zn-dependent peptidase